jgi:hypothetical protein
MSTVNAETVDLEAIRERLALVAHFGTDWEVIPDADDHDWIVAYPSDRDDAGHLAAVPDYGEHVAELIANAPKDLTDLLAEVDQLRFERDQWKGSCELARGSERVLTRQRDEARAEVARLRTP